MNRIIVIGDVHGQSGKLSKVISTFGSYHIYCTGDLPESAVDSEPGKIDECIRLLVDNKVVTVKGNHDAWMEKDVPFLKTLPLTCDIHTPFGPALLCHGIGLNYMGKVGLDDYGYAIQSNSDLQNIIDGKKYSIIINGHSHKKMIRRISEITVINAGSLIHDPGFIEIDMEKRNVIFYIFTEDDQIIQEKEICF